jgi:putative transposase
MNIVESQVCYRSLFTTHIEGTLLDDIREANQSGMALGNDRFKEDLASLTSRRLQALPSGRKLGWRNN